MQSLVVGPRRDRAGPERFISFILPLKLPGTCVWLALNYLPAYIVWGSSASLVSLLVRSPGGSGICPLAEAQSARPVYALFYQKSPLLANSLTAAASLVTIALLWTAWKGEWEVNEPRFGFKFSLLLTISVVVNLN